MEARRDGQGRWNALKHQVKARWNRLTDEDINNVGGNRERLVDALRQRYGYARWFADREIAKWSRSLAAAQPDVARQN